MSPSQLTSTAPFLTADDHDLGRSQFSKLLMMTAKKGVVDNSPPPDRRVKLSQFCDFCR
jgi:hypothetical protein